VPHVILLAVVRRSSWTLCGNAANAASPTWEAANAASLAWEAANAAPELQHRSTMQTPTTASAQCALLAPGERPGQAAASEGVRDGKGSATTCPSSVCAYARLDLAGF